MYFEFINGSKRNAEKNKRQEKAIKKKEKMRMVTLIVENSQLSQVRSRANKCAKKKNRTFRA